MTSPPSSLLRLLVRRSLVRRSLVRRALVLAALALASALPGCWLTPGGACDSTACAADERCAVGADGLARCVADDPCADVPCPANSHCELPSDTLLISCVCDSGFDLAADRLSCVPPDPDTCSLTCSIYGPAHCEEPEPGEEECRCDAGFAANPQGDYCVPRGTCSGIDCSVVPSSHCVLDADDAPVCACDAGFEPNADATVCISNGSDPCTGVSCAGRGMCVDVSGSPRCICDPGWRTSSDGYTCVEEAADPCDGVTCSGRGTCADFGGTPRCSCDAGFTVSSDGRSCLSSPGSPCDGVTCSGRGACGEFGGVARCVCDPGYQPSTSGLACIPESPASTEGFVYVPAGTGPWNVGDAVYVYVDGLMRGGPNGAMTYFSIGATCGAPTAPSCGAVQGMHAGGDRWCDEVLRLPAGSYTLTAMLNRGGPNYARWSYPITVTAGTCAYRPINFGERIAETGIVRGHVEDSFGRRLEGFLVTSDEGASDVTDSSGNYELTVDAGARTVTADGPNGRMSRDITVFPGTTFPLSFIFLPQ